MRRSAARRSLTITPRASGVHRLRRRPCLARQGESKGRICQLIQAKFAYDLNRTIVDIRSTYSFDGSCQGTVPEAIIAFLDSSDYEDTVRLAISLGGSL